MKNDLTRRNVLGGAAALASSALLPGCGKSEAKPTPSPSAAPAAIGNATKPETPDMRFGIIALTDNSPIVIAHEKGFFKKYGINSTIIKGASWAAIRDSLSNGDIQATHMLIGMPIASTMGLLGSPKKPMIIPWLLNRNGQAITMKKALKGKVEHRSEGAEAAGRRSQGQGHADDVRDDVSAGNARDVDALLPRQPAASTRTRTWRSSPSRRRRWSPT